MSARPRRPADFATLSNLERLILAQAVYELGAAPASWPPIAKILSKHPLLTRPKSFFTPALCSAAYDFLLNEAGLERADENNATKAESNLQLAQRYFQLRYDELVQLIKDEEAKFKTIMAGINDIRDGKWDSRIRAQIAGIPDDTQDEHAELDRKQSTPAIGPGPVSHEESAHESPAVNQGQPGSTTLVPIPDTYPNSVVPESEGKKEEEEEQSENEDDDSQRSGADVIPPTTAEHESKGNMADSPDNEREMDEAEELLDVSSERDVGPEHDNSTMHNEIVHMKETELDDGASSGDEPLQTIRRSTRRKSSASSAPSLPRTRARRQQRQAQEHEISPIPESGIANDNEKVETPHTDDNIPSSPYEPASARTREGKRKASFIETLDTSGRESKRLREDSEYADDDDQESPAQNTHNTRSRPTRQGIRSEEQVALKRFQNVIGLVHSQISQHRNGTIFHNPIKPSEAPDYNEIVKKPMDLKTIKTRVKDGLISNSLEFQRDIYLMFANAMMYNRPGSDVYTMAEDMMLEAEAQIYSFRQTEGFVRGVHR